MDRRVTGNINCNWTFLVIAALVALATCPSEARKRSPTTLPPPAEVSVGGLNGDSIKLPCNLPVSNPPNLQWYDEVYNTDVEPQLIFTSSVEGEEEDETSNQLTINPQHPNRENFEIDDEYTLTISNLNFDTGAGKYFCHSGLDDETVNKIEYQLTVIEKPTCTGTTELQSGQNLSLSCSLSYSGSRPFVEWYRTVKDEHHGHNHHHEKHIPQLIPSIDDFDIRETVVAGKIIKNVAQPTDDQSTYHCKVVIGELKMECHMKLSVQYLVQNVKITPEGHEAFVGDVIKCMADGNPKPSVELKLGTEESALPGHSFVITSDYVNQNLTVYCSASNSVNEVKESLSTSRTFHVSERLIPTEPAPLPASTHGHHKHDHVPHQSHPLKTKEEQRQAVAGAQPIQEQKPVSGSSGGNTEAVLMTVISCVLAVVALH